MQTRQALVEAARQLFGTQGYAATSEYDEAAGVVVAHVKPYELERRRCPTCRRRCPGYDRGEGRRRWRALDLGTMRAVLEADAPRVRCPEHGPTVAAGAGGRPR